MLKTLLRYSLPLIISSGADSADPLRQNPEPPFLSSESPSFRTLALEKQIIWNTYTPPSPHLTLTLDSPAQENTDNIYKTLVEDNKKCGKQLKPKNHPYLERAVINGDQLACITYIEYLSQLHTIAKPKRFDITVNAYVNNLDRHARAGSPIAFMILDLGLKAEAFGKRTVKSETMLELENASKVNLKGVDKRRLSILKNKVISGLNHLVAAKLQRVADGKDDKAIAARLELIEFYWQGGKGLSPITGNRLAKKYAYEDPIVAKMLIRAFNNNEMKLRKNVRWAKNMMVEVLEAQSKRGEAYFQFELLMAYELGRYGIDASDRQVQQQGFDFAINVLNGEADTKVPAKKKKIGKVRNKRGVFRHSHAKHIGIEDIHAIVVDAEKVLAKQLDTEDFRIMFKRLCNQQWLPLLNNPTNYQNYIKYVRDVEDEKDSASELEGFRFSHFASILMDNEGQSKENSDF